MALTERPRKRWTNNYENPYQKVGISNQQPVACNQQIAIGIPYHFEVAPLFRCPFIANGEYAPPDAEQ